MPTSAMTQPGGSPTTPGSVDGRALAARTFRYSPTHRVLVCIPCRCAVFDAESQLSRHLRKFHRHGPGPHLSTGDAIEYFGEFPDRIRRIGDFQPPSWPMAAIPGLIVQPKTFQCTYPSCQYIGRDMHRIQEHARRRHDWKNPDLRFRHNRSLDRESLPWTEVASQSLIVRGRGATYYPVVVDPSYRTSTAGVGRAGDSNEPPATPAVTVAVSPLRSRRPVPSSSAWSAQTASDQIRPPRTPVQGSSTPGRSPNQAVSSRRTEASPRGRSSPRVVSSQVNPAPTAHRLREAVKEWGNYCVLCRRILGDVVCPHTPRSRIEVVRTHECDHRSARAIQMARQQLSQRLLEADQLHSCPRCALPYQYCGRKPPISSQDPPRGSETAGDRRGLRAQCRFRSAVVPMVLGILVEEFDGAKGQLLEWAAEADIDVDDDDALYSWLATPTVWGGMECFRVTQIFGLLHEFIVGDAELCRAYRIGDHGFARGSTDLS